MTIPPEHLLIETEKDTAALGGQHCGTFPIGVTVTHLPSGLKAFCNYERSQYKNRKIAIEMIEYACCELKFYE